MTIEIAAKRIPKVSLDIALDWYDSIIDMGFNGSYNRSFDEESDSFGLTLTLEVDSMIPEIRKMTNNLRDYITDFSCVGNVVTTTQFNGDENLTSDTGEDSTEITVSEEPSAVTDSSPKIAPKIAAELFFNDISGKNIDEITNNTINVLFAGNIKRQTTYNNYKTLTAFYAKAENKPKTFNALCTVANKKISPTTVKKVNILVQQKFGLNTFMEFLKCMPEFAEKENLDSEPEEVILKKPKKPPKRTLISSDVSNKEEILNQKMRKLDYEIKNIPTNIPISEKVNLLLGKMGIQNFEKNNRNFLKKLFGSILFFREANIDKLFNRDKSLKRFGTLDVAESVLIEFLENFFKIPITNEDLAKFFEELIFKFFGSTEKTQNDTSLSSVSVVKRNYTDQQNSSIFKCFPKHDKFDNFIRGVYFSRGTRKFKVARILNYMGLKNLPEDEKTIIEKLCLKNLYMLDFYNPEQNYTEEEKLILERFVNNFAKTLVENANFISLKDFIRELSKIP